MLWEEGWMGEDSYRTYTDQGNTFFWWKKYKASKLKDLNELSAF